MNELLDLAMNAHGINRGKSGNVSARWRADDPVALTEIFDAESERAHQIACRKPPSAVANRASDRQPRSRHQTRQQRKLTAACAMESDPE